MIKRIFQIALSQFICRESDNIRTGVSERNLCARFSIVLESVAKEHGFADYHADVEYNRKQHGRVKTLINDNMEVVAIQCDLILHSRGRSIERDNLLAIEMKKSDRPRREVESDRKRLRALTKSSYDGIWSYDGIAHPEHVCGYELGALVELNVRNEEARIEYFADGNPIGEIERRRLVSRGIA